jgi:hypothetical protein
MSKLMFVRVIPLFAAQLNRSRVPPATADPAYRSDRRADDKECQYLALRQEKRKIFDF